MKLVIGLNLWICLCSLIGLGYGVKFFFKRSKALYLKMITFGVACIMYSRLFQVIYLTTQGNLNRGFHVGILGIVASFMFFFSANYGQMDGLVDDRTDKFKATRIYALIAPIIIFLMYLVFFFTVNKLEIRIIIGIVALIIMQCSYYSFKHIIIYDVELGIINSIKKYNILVVAYSVLIMLEFIGKYTEFTPLYIIACLGIGGVSLVLLPILKGGFDSWKI